MRKNIFKKIALLSSLVMASALMSGYTPVEGDGHPDNWDIDNTQFVYDYADVFSNDEELKLQDRAEKLGAELGLDLIIVSTKDIGREANSSLSDSTMDRYEREYAEGFYLEGGYDDGILYLIDEHLEGVYLVRSGMAEVYLDDGDHETLLDAVWEQFEVYDYYDSAEAFLDTVEDIVGDRKDDSDFEKLEEAWNEGGYVYYDEFWADYSSDIKEAHEDSIFTPFKNPLLCLGIGAVVAFISVLIMCFSSSTKMTANSKTYMKQGSFNVLHRFDRFTHTTTTTRKVQSSSSSGGGSGRSSSHRSGGRSFSGGGRRR